MTDGARRVARQEKSVYKEGGTDWVTRSLKRVGSDGEVATEEKAGLPPEGGEGMLPVNVKVEQREAPRIHRNKDGRQGQEQRSRPWSKQLKHLEPTRYNQLR